MTSAPAETAVPPVAELVDLGVTVCCGSDGIRDAWSPFGTGDMLERAYLTAYRFDWNTDDDFRRALDCATGAAARAIGIDDHGLRPGARADFVMIDAVTAGDAVLVRDQYDDGGISGGTLERPGWGGRQHKFVELLVHPLFFL